MREKTKSTQRALNTHWAEAALVRLHVVSIVIVVDDDVVVVVVVVGVGGVVGIIDFLFF